MKKREESFQKGKVKISIDILINNVIKIDR